MPIIESQAGLRACQNLPFCYLCGELFQDDDKTTRDHVPPKSIFAASHRTNPLILRVHEACNQRESIGDEVLGQLVAVLHKKYPERDRMKLNLIRGKHVDTGEEALFLIKETDFRLLIWRYVKGFHAALYRCVLEASSKWNVHLPMPEARREDGTIVYADILPQQWLFSEEIKKNRLAQTTDRLACWNGKCVYECTWVRADTGGWVCIFALRLYDWENLGDTRNAPRRGCVGYYSPAEGKPESATAGTSLVLPPPGGDRLDPFN